MYWRNAMRRKYCWERRGRDSRKDGNSSGRYHRLAVVGWEVRRTLLFKMYLLIPCENCLKICLSFSCFACWFDSLAVQLCRGKSEVSIKPTHMGVKDYYDFLLHKISVRCRDISEPDKVNRPLPCVAQIHSTFMVLKWCLILISFAGCIHAGATLESRVWRNLECDRWQTEPEWAAASGSLSVTAMAIQGAPSYVLHDRQSISKFWSTHKVGLPDSKQRWLDTKFSASGARRGTLGVSLATHQKVLPWNPASTWEQRNVRNRIRNLGHRL